MRTSIKYDIPNMKRDDALTALIADNLRSLRVNFGMTTRELGGKIGISKSAISQYENRLRMPTIQALIAYADYFNVSVDFLLGRENTDTDGHKRVRPNKKLHYIEGLTQDEYKALKAYLKIHRKSGHIKG